MEFYLVQPSAIHGDVSQAFLLDPFGNQVYVFLYIPTWHHGLVYPGLPPLNCDDTSIPSKT